MHATLATDLNEIIEQQNIKINFDRHFWQSITVKLPILTISNKVFSNGIFSC
jgi:hypothetical protein